MWLGLHDSSDIFSTYCTGSNVEVVIIQSAGIQVIQNIFASRGAYLYIFSLSASESIPH